jgi:predicted XRE-type DNA-binding protein
MRNGRAAAKAKPDPETGVEGGSGNVFADLGVPRPDVALAKAKLVQQLRDAVTARGLTQAKAATLLGLDQPKVSALMRGRTDGFSIDRLFRFLNALGRHVEITVRPVATAERAETRVVGGPSRVG